MSNAVSPILRLENLTVGYDRPLLRDVSASFSAGITGIVANNGKGKTTLLKCISGLMQPLAGNIFLNEENLGRMDSKDRAKRLSFNFSLNPVSFPITVRELVSMGRYPYLSGWTSLQYLDKKIVQHALERCGITGFAERKVMALSDGERQKVFIAKALAQQTQVMLFDEPTAFLDHSSKKYFFCLMREISRTEQKIVIVSSHDVHFLSAYADHLLMIEDDESVLAGSVGTVTDSEYFKAHFGKV